MNKNNKHIFQSNLKQVVTVGVNEVYLFVSLVVSLIYFLDIYLNAKYENWMSSSNETLVSEKNIIMPMVLNKNMFILS